MQLIKVLHFPQTANAFEVDGILRSSFPPLGEQEWVVLYRAKKGSRSLGVVELPQGKTSWDAEALKRYGPITNYSIIWWRLIGNRSTRITRFTAL